MTTPNSNEDNRINYRAFLVRVWHDSDGQAKFASAEKIPSGETIRFGELSKLFTYLIGADSSLDADTDIDMDAD